MKLVWYTQKYIHIFLTGFGSCLEISEFPNEKIGFGSQCMLPTPLIDAIGHKISVKVMHESYKAAVTALENMMVCEKAR